MTSLEGGIRRACKYTCTCTVIVTEGYVHELYTVYVLYCCIYMHLYAFVCYRFVLMVPPASAPPMTFHVSHPDPSYLLHSQVQHVALETFLSSRCQILHNAATGMSLQFPETRLIQYDCGQYMHVHMYN